LLAELARGRWLTGLPWGASGYSHVDGPLAVLAPWVGVYGMGGVAASVVALLAAWAARWPSARNRPTGLLASGRPVLWVLAGLILALSCAWAANSSFTRPAGRISVALLQGNIPQDEKFQPGSGVPQALRWYAEQLLATKADLAIAPETAIPLLPQQLPPGYLARLSDRFANGSQAALIGIPAGNAEQGYSNAVLGLKPGLAAPYRYDKHHLVPFGEFIPPMFRWFTDMMNIPLGDFRRGPLVQNSFEWKGQRIAPNICYEDLFGEELALRFADAGGAPTIFANLSNIAWFGNGIAIDQHLNISRMRALEFQRPFVRATNTGATVIIDHQGTVTHALARASRGVLRGEVFGRDGLTPYARWAGQLGLWPLWLLGWGAVVLAFTWRRRRRGG
jgi:apolipoprotein N-acyltransferase